MLFQTPKDLRSSSEHKGYKNIYFFIKSESFLTLHRQQRN